MMFSFLFPFLFFRASDSEAPFSRQQTVTRLAFAARLRGAGAAQERGAAQCSAACVRGGWRARAARSSPPSSRSCDPLSVQLFSKLSARGVAAAAAKAPPTGQVRDAHVVGVPRLRAFRPARRPAGARGALLASASCAAFASAVRARGVRAPLRLCLPGVPSQRSAGTRPLRPRGATGVLRQGVPARTLGSVRTFWRGRLRLFTRASVSVARVTRGCLHHAFAASGGALALPNALPRAAVAAAAGLRASSERRFDAAVPSTVIPAPASAWPQLAGVSLVCDGWRTHLVRCARALAAGAPRQERSGRSRTRAAPRARGRSPQHGALVCAPRALQRHRHRAALPAPVQKTSL